MRQVSSTYRVPYSEMPDLQKRLRAAEFDYGYAESSDMILSRGKDSKILAVVTRLGLVTDRNCQYEFKVGNFPDARRLDNLMRVWCRELTGRT